MLKLRIAVCILICVFISRCATQKKQEMIYLEGASAEYQVFARKRFDKGQFLYKENCAKCHGIFTPGRADAPKFDSVQLHNYGLAIIKGDEKNHAVMQGVTEEDYECIKAFVNWRKK